MVFSGCLWVKVGLLEVLALSRLWFSRKAGGGSVVSPLGSVLADLGWEAGVAAFVGYSEADPGGPQS